MKRALHPRGIAIEPSLDVVACCVLYRSFVAGCGLLGPDGITLWLQFGGPGRSSLPAPERRSLRSRRASVLKVRMTTASSHGPQLLRFVSMKKGRVSSGGGCFWVRDLVWVVGVERCSCLYGLLVGRIRRNWNASLVGACPTRAVMPPDEKRRLWERIAGCGKACARSRGRAGGRCRPGRSWRRAACRVGACCAGSAARRRGA